MNKNEELFLSLFKERYHYYKQWYHKIPFIVSKSRNEELKKIQEILYRSTICFSKCYKEYSDIMPLEEKIHKIIELYKDKEYKPGTYRPDILLDINGGLKVCEITSRFWCPGYLVSYFADMHSEILSKKYKIENRLKGINKVLDYIVETLGYHKNVIILRTKDKAADVHYYKPLFESLGAKVRVLQVEEIKKYRKEIKNNLIICDFNQIEFLQLDLKTIEEIIQQEPVNDLRNLYLLHDKRFFSILQEDSFLKRFLNLSEIKFLKERIVKTYTYNQNREIWIDAFRNKNKYIIKPARLGKSEKIYAGKVCTEEEWSRIFKSKDINEMILQPYIEQRRFKIKLKDKEYNEFAVATILCINNEYCGLGVIRASDYLITNHKDDRKFVSIVCEKNIKNFINL